MSHHGAGRGGHGGRGGHRGHGGLHLGSMVFGVLIAPWIYRLMHHRKHHPRPVGRHSPLRGLTYPQVMTAMSAARVIGFIAMCIAAGYIAYTMGRIG